jgi:hypothetical protein
MTTTVDGTNGITFPDSVNPSSDAVLTQDGYQKFPGGFILQWGQFSTATTVTFPIAFPTACAHVSVSWFGNPGNAYSLWLGVTAYSTTGFTPGGGSSGTNRSWVALGY